MRTMNKLVMLIALLVCIPGYAQRKVSIIVPPPGYVRHEADSYGTYLRNLPLKRPGSPVMLYNGVEKGYQDGAYAVTKWEGFENYGWTEQVEQAVNKALDENNHPRNMYYFRTNYFHTFGKQYIKSDDLCFTTQN